MQAGHAFRVLALSILLVMTGAGSGLAANTCQIKIGMSGALDPKKSEEFIWAQSFADIMKEGGCKVVYYPNSSLGGSAVRMEAAMLGLLEVNFTGSEDLKFYSPYIEASDLPFLFDSNDMFDRFLLKTDFLDKVNKTTRQKGIRVVDVTLGGGMSGLFTARTPVANLKSASQLHIRAMGKVQARVLQSWNVPAVHVAWEEVSQALQTGIVDGYINPPIIAVMYGHQGQLDYFTDLRIWPSSRFVTISEKWYQGLSAQDKALVTRAIDHARHVNRAWNKSFESESYELLRNAGIEIIPLPSEVRQDFRKASETLYLRDAAQAVLTDITTMLDQVRERP